MAVAAPPRTLANLWHVNRRDVRHYGAIMSDARADRLPGVRANPSGYGWLVTDEKAALAAMRKEQS